MRRLTGGTVATQQRHRIILVIECIYKVSTGGNMDIIDIEVDEEIDLDILYRPGIPK